MFSRRFASPIVPAIALVALAGGVASAQPTSSPVYSVTAQDALTGDNNFISGGFRYWTIDAGADSYQNDVYERPTAQGFQLIGTRYAINEYFSYVDIDRARFGFDNRFVYVSIKVAGLTKQTQDGVNTFEGLQGIYGVRFGADADGRNSYYLKADQPQSASVVNTAWTLAKTEGFRDTDMDVGGRGGPIHGQPGPSGLTVTKVDNILEEAGLNGYDQQFISTDGLLVNGQIPVLWQRVNPTDNTVVELALDYVAAGIARAELEAIQYLHFEAQLGDLSDPQFGLWNDQFTGIEAGSPNLGIGTDNEFGTQGLGAISGVDTVRGTLVVPPPPPVTGACCIANLCTLQSAANCALAGGTFRGAGTICTANSCCPLDFDASGLIEVADLFLFIDTWFTQIGACSGAACSTNVDGNAVVDVNDLFFYLNNWFGAVGTTCN